MTGSRWRLLKSVAVFRKRLHIYFDNNEKWWEYHAATGRCTGFALAANLLAALLSTQQFPLEETCTTRVPQGKGKTWRSSPLLTMLGHKPECLRWDQSEECHATCRAQSSPNPNPAPPFFLSGAVRVVWEQERVWEVPKKAGTSRLLISWISGCNFKLLCMSPGLISHWNYRTSSVGDSFTNHTILSALQLCKRAQSILSVSFITANLNSKLIWKSETEKFSNIENTLQIVLAQHFYSTSISNTCNGPYLIHSYRNLSRGMSF